MKKKISLYRKIKLFRQFKKTINESQVELQTKFNIRIDAAQRMYTVLNISPESIGEAFALKKTDVDRISETYIKEYSNELAKYLDTKGLNELYDFYDIKKITDAKYSYLIVFGFSLFRSNKYYNTLYYGLIPGSVIVLLSLILILF
jgi:hypothetical protein